MLSRLRRYPTKTTWAITALMAVTSGVLLIPLVGSSIPKGAPFEVPWWVLAIIFGAVELGGIHISTRRGAHTLTLAELPVVLGLGAALPGGLVIARLAGLIGTLSWVRWQNALKLAFNMANALLGTAIALSIFRVILGQELVTDPRGWLAIAAGVTAEGLVSGLLVAVVIAVNDRERRLPEILRGLTVSWLMSLATAVVSLLVFVALSTSLWGGVIGIFVIAGLVFAAKIYGRLHRRHEELTAVFGLTEAIEGPLSVAEIVERVLVESSRFLRVDSAELLHRSGEDEWRTASLGADGSIEVAAIDTTTATAITEAIGHHVLWLDSDPPESIGTWQSLGAPRNGVIAPLVSRRALVGALAIGDRPGPLSGFGDEDIGLITTFSGYIAAKIDQALTEELLRREVEEKQQIIRSKDQLIAAVSHELRTPLTGILGFAETLREYGHALDPEVTAEAVASIANESTDLANIVDDLLTAARFELGALNTHSTPNDLAKLARWVIDNVSGRLGLEIEADLHSVVANVDAPRVRQILRNLISNAGRYGGDRIRVCTSRSNDGATVEVRDNGPGIGDADPESIFDAYQSAHDPGTQPGSVGLGLTISRHLARLMGGDLTFRRDDDWSVFSLEFHDDRPAERVQA